MTGPDQFGELEQLIAEFERSGLRELQVRAGDLEIYLSQDTTAAGLGIGSQVEVALSSPTTPAAAALPPVPEPVAAAAQAWPDGATVVAAPYLGTFYRSPKPGSPPYVEVGGDVTADSELCLVEVMKLFTAVRAGTAGKVVQVLASDGDLVSADQPLFVIAPIVGGAV